MSSLQPNDIHFVAKGKLGIVVHPDGPTKAWVDCWVKDREPMPERSLWATRFISKDGCALALNHTIPYAATVLVLSAPLPLTGARELYYHVLHNDVECWVRSDYLINPYHTSLPPNEP